MPPKRELSIRLRADLRTALDHAATSQGQTITSIVEDALAAHLGVAEPEQGHPTLADRVRELEARVAALEGNASHRNATQRTATHRIASQGTAPQRIATPTTAPTEGQYQADGVGHPKADGQRWLTTGQALQVSAARGGPDNRSTLMKWAEDGRLASLGLRHCPHGTRHKNLASFEDLRVEG